MSIMAMIGSRLIYSLACILFRVPMTMTITRRMVRILLLALWALLPIHTTLAADPLEMSQSKRHPLTDTALSRAEADPQLAQSPSVRKWLEAVEDDVEIRQVFSTEELQTRLNRAASATCRHCVMSANLRRLDAQTRLAYVDSGMPLICNRNRSIDASKDIDLDLAYRVFYQGLQAEARSMPLAGLTKARTVALERAFGIKALQVLADIPGGAEKLADMGQGNLSAEESACFSETLLRAALVKMDEADRDDLVLFILGGLDTSASSSRSARSPRQPFEQSQQLFDTKFVLSALPSALRGQLVSLGGTLPVKRIRTDSFAVLKTRDKKDYFEMTSDCTVVTAMILRCRTQGTSMDGEPVFSSLFLGGTSAWTRIQQDHWYGAAEQAPTEYTLLKTPARRLMPIKPDSRTTFTVLSWQGAMEGRAKEQSVSCQSGGRYSASTIRATLTGMAIDVNCRTTERGVEISRYTFSYLEDLRINLGRTWVYPEGTYTITYNSVTVE